MCSKPGGAWNAILWALARDARAILLEAKQNESNLAKREGENGGAKEVDRKKEENKKGDPWVEWTRCAEQGKPGWGLKCEIFNSSYSKIFQFRQLLTWPRFPPILSIDWAKRRVLGTRNFQYLKKKPWELRPIRFFSSLRASLIFIVSALCVSQFLVLC